MKTKIFIAITGIGVFLFLLSFVWGFIFPAEKVWTPEKSQMVSELSKKVHMMHMKVKLGDRDPSAFGDEDPETVRQEFEQSKAKLESLQADFKKVSNSPEKIANTLRWVGMLSAIVGLVAIRTTAN